MKFKYPRTPHLLTSPGKSSDDVTTKHDFAGQHVVVTEKMDGENTTIYNDGSFHARSLDSKAHTSRSYLHNLISRVYKLPDGYRICAENLYAKHSIHYKKLTSLLQVFSIWNNDTCLSWSDTVAWCDELQMNTVSVIFYGIYDEANVQSEFIDYANASLQEVEGYVVRSTISFKMSEFDKNVAKWVRPNHVQTDDHWMHKSVVKNLTNK